MAETAAGTSQRLRLVRLAQSTIAAHAWQQAVRVSRETAEEQERWLGLIAGVEVATIRAFGGHLRQYRRSEHSRLGNGLVDEGSVGSKGGRMARIINFC